MHVPEGNGLSGSCCSANGNISLSAQIGPFARAKSQLQVRAKKTANRAADTIGEK